MNSGKSVQILEILRYKRKVRGHEKISTANWIENITDKNVESGRSFTLALNWEQLHKLTISDSVLQILCPLEDSPGTWRPWQWARTLSIQWLQLANDCSLVRSKTRHSNDRSPHCGREGDGRWCGGEGGLCGCHMQRTGRGRRVGIKSAYFLFSSVTKYIILQYPPPCMYCRKGRAALDGDTH